jgi:probable HAF family extracellular repeat protein
MSGRERARRLLVGVLSTGLSALTILTLAPAATPVKAAVPPAYYAVAVGMVSGITSPNAMNEAGVVAAKDGVDLARVTGPTVQTIAAPGGYPFAINEAGTIVGSADSGAIRADGTTVTSLPGLAGGTFETAYDIDETGTTIVGASAVGAEQHAWVNDGTSTTELVGLGDEYTIASKVNGSGLIAGSSRNAAGDMHLVTWQGGVITDLGNEGNYFANVLDMNEAGQILAGVGISGSGDRGVVWDGTSLVNLGTLGGTTTWPSRMNEAGKIVVTSRDAAGRNRAASWEAGNLIDLGTLPGGTESFGSGINDQGQITGTSFVAPDRTHGFLIDDGVMYDLNDLLPARSVEITGASEISDSGHIIASGTNGQPILLVPGTRPTADYDVVDLGDGLGTPSFDAFPADLNATRQATGSLGSRAFRYDGTTSAYIFPTFNESHGLAINEAGTVAGYADQGGDLQAFSYDGTVHVLGTLGGASSAAQDINDSGDIVGSADTSGGQRHAFIYRGGVMTDLHTLGGTTSVATDVNAPGTVIGNYSPTPGTFRGFVSDGTTTTDLGTLGGGFTAPNAINGSDEIVGTSSTPSQPNHAFHYAAGAMTSIAPPGSTGSEGIDINEAGGIAGSYLDGSANRRAFRLVDGAFDLIPALGGAFATSTDINEAGQVVGYSTTESGGNRAYRFDDSGVIDLSEHMPLGYESIVNVAFRIADDGTILARGVRSDSRESVLLLIPTTPTPPPSLTIDTSRPAASSVARYGRFEKEFTLNRTYDADVVHDPSLIDVTATFRAPSGATYTVPAFFGTDYTLRPGTGIGGSELYDPVPGTESGVWHARFSPDETGLWRYTLRAQDKRPGQTATRVSAQLTFSVTASTAKGQIERDPRDDRFLRYSDGTPYYPMGHNVAFGDGNPFNDGSHYYEPHFQSMQDAGQNWTRVWMTDFYITTLEWESSHFSGQYQGVGRYADIPAFRVEQILDLADQHGLEVQLVLNDHGQFSSHVNARWDGNPYSDANGGPVPAADPAAFFSDPAAKQLFKQRLRYLVARYGAYRDILAWELFNETQFIGSASRNPFTSQEVRDDLVAWHAEMAAYLRSLDPYDHLITTSSDIDTSAAAIWNDPNIDLVQVHDYGSLGGRDQRFRGYAEDLNATYDKPVLIGEFGLNGEPELAFDPTTSTLLPDRIAHLVQATHLHNSMWATAMSASGAMSWWWGGYILDNAAQHRTPPDFPANQRHNPPLRDFLAGEDLAGMSLETSTITAPATVIALGMDNGSEGFAWIRDAQNEYGSGVGPGDEAGRTISGVSIGIDGFADGTYGIELHDPWGLAPIAESIATASGGTLTVSLPNFTRDVALRIAPAPITAPSAPTGVTAAKGNAQATISWTPPADGGSPITSYTVTSSPGGLTATVDGATTSAVVTGLTNGTTYTFTVTATNGVGTSSPSAPSNAVTPAAPVPQTINFPQPPNSTLAQSPLVVTATASSELPVTLTSSTPAVCSATGLSVNLLTAGTCTITASQAGDADFQPAAPVTRSFTVRQAAQTITFPKPPNATMLQSPVAITATSNSGLPVTVTSSTQGVCTIDAFSVTLFGPGTCTLTATQAGNTVYLAATPVVRSFTVSKVAQTITFPRPANATLIQSPLTLAPTASSGLPVTLASTTPSVCTVNGYQVTLVIAGTCTLRATQPGDAVYLAATDILRSFNVTKATQTITLPNPGTQSLQNPTVILNPSATSGLPVTLASQSTTVCTVSGNTVTLRRAGTCRIRATQPGDATYAAAPAVAISFSVTQ